MSEPFVYILGNRGNMGRRYASILTHLGVDHGGSDRNDEFHGFEDPRITHVIVATPTDDHLHHLRTILRHLKDYDRQVLCLVEKPIHKVAAHPSIKAFVPCGALFDDFDAQGSRLFMVNNYAYYPFEQAQCKHGRTFYDFYHSGPDGLAWDCIQIIALANYSISLSNESPIWAVMINGERLDKNLMDFTFVDMIEDFIFHYKGKLWGREAVFHAYQATLRYLNLINEKQKTL